ncbi:tetratricopeptide repeat protein [Rhodopirellula sp. P2]|uniref:tetratricopeptide repeat protein n=1 Tax=Rhodopirellula sp. P2 TaxID=2127060 RepID=UPI0023684D3D|nr:tetratricopeptide repeat protein [Rhodopirellula sp. P2]WDQ14797.1 hypothetical protein PSR62_14225 [Rhodopirellula sp. P2]
MEIVSIQAKHYWTCLWPGMSELWWRGRLSALPASVAFAAVVNALLIAKFIYPGWMSGALVMLACWIVAAAWGVLTVRSIRELPLLLSPRQVSDQPDRFAEAQVAYLTGNYALAEEALTAGLSIEPRDPPALLLLAAVLRHTGRLNAADALLTEIPKLEAAAAWNLEWESERARLERDLDSRGELQDDAESAAEESDEPESASIDEAEAGAAAFASHDRAGEEDLSPDELPPSGSREPDGQPSTLSLDTALESFAAEDVQEQSGDQHDGQRDDDQKFNDFSEAA